MDRRTDRNNLTGKSTPVFKEWTDGQKDRKTDISNLTGKSNPSLERMDRWTDGQIEII